MSDNPYQSSGDNSKVPERETDDATWPVWLLAIFALLLMAGSTFLAVMWGSPFHD